MGRLDGNVATEINRFPLGGICVRSGIFLCLVISWVGLIRKRQ
jgi:hypothetical protein